MSTAIWAIHYAVAASDRPAYAAWFHGTHIPEKLARPGYTAAAHYEALDASGRFLALFRAADAKAFLSPTPGQLKTRQDALTRKMMGLRAASGMSVLTEAIRVGPPAAVRAPQAVRFAQFAYPDAAAEDAAAGWLAQERLPAVAEASGVLGAAFLVAATGPGRHALLEEYDSDAALAANPVTYPGAAPHVAGSPFEGRRVWPPPGA